MYRVFQEGGDDRKDIESGYKDFPKVLDPE